MYAEYFRKIEEILLGFKIWRMRHYENPFKIESKHVTSASFSTIGVIINIYTKINIFNNVNN